MIANNMMNLINQMKSAKEVVRDGGRIIRRPDLQGRSVALWTDEDIEKLKEISETTTISEMMVMFGRTRKAIDYRLKLLGLGYKRDTFCKESERNKLWTDSEVSFLKNNAKNLTATQIANELGRSRASVKGKCKSLGIVWIHTNGRPRKNK